MMFNYPYPQRKKETVNKTTSQKRKKLKKEMRKNDFKADCNFIKQFNYEK